MDKKIQDLARDFIDNSDYFSQETIADLDIKHKDIVSSHYQNFNLSANFNEKILETGINKVICLFQFNYLYVIYYRKKFFQFSSVYL
ncbi:hypothetical protein LEP1GSC151_1684 [Leptospira interrogans serovar Grippotyphosa str. LT2186]|uniref:Uncharacterized protein n=1 Tax=Leptospira interrogans serovar Grippotyphosa str. LT2186 TaxID=1001599 RepID=M3I8A0_LEPIR|nr:hypothetical protein LEP1GSC151_1684 [Leptospira interrogans serovar Grippotyphosa str. LT2186]